MCWRRPETSRRRRRKDKLSRRGTAGVKSTQRAIRKKKMGKRTWSKIKKGHYIGIEHDILMTES